MKRMHLSLMTVLIINNERPRHHVIKNMDRLLLECFATFASLCSKMSLRCVQMMNYKVPFVVFGIGCTALALPVLFSNVIVEAPPLSVGATWVVIGNSISFNLPNAIVGDPVSPLRSGTLNIQFDGVAPAPAIGNEVGINLGTAISGSGTIFFQEQVFELDSLGNEVGGGPIGVISHIFSPGDPVTWSDMITFVRPVERFRAKKFFTLSAVETSEFDLAAVGIVNQNIQVVPEPATLAVLGIGIATLLRRRRL